MSEDAADSTLHRVIGKLSEVASEAAAHRRPAMSAAAARCLGEIGPCDLHTLVLQPEAAVRARAKNPFQDYAGRIVEMTLAYLGRYSVLSRGSLCGLSLTSCVPCPCSLWPWGKCMQSTSLHISAK